jgi:hypothetical protein
VQPRVEPVRGPDDQAIHEQSDPHAGSRDHFAEDADLVLGLGVLKDSSLFARRMLSYQDGASPGDL